MAQQRRPRPPFALGFILGKLAESYLYTRFMARETWWISLTATFLSWLFFWALFIRLLHIRFGEGLMQKGLSLL